MAFDSYWSSPNSDGMGETVMYRFGSVGQVSEKYWSCLQFLVFVIRYLMYKNAIIPL